MSKEVTLLAWNVRDGLSDPDRAVKIAEKIAEINPDVAIISEGTHESNHVDYQAQLLLEKHVGDVYAHPYNDADNRLDRHSLVAIVRPELGEPDVEYNAGRAGFYLRTLPFTVAGLHGYDRMQDDVTQSDALRVAQVRQVLGRVAQNAVIIGDINSMYPEDMTARLLRMLEPVANRLPAKNPNEPQSKVERLGSLAQRLCQMAQGGPLLELQAAGFVDADPRHQPTMAKGPLAIQLDHMLARGVEITDFMVHNIGDLSDHSLLSASARS